ncbi:hypothetical protein NE237_010942 [Protea cynaroides]|uniref:Uncharacterized protein n=1 Tax=Protea cynaroides TaxID=273540 RepID=A0A9Q0L0P8_9MAGN|nr:hypothetical protein NE237_010942 [Protea cynaroides]
MMNGRSKRGNGVRIERNKVSKLLNKIVIRIFQITDVFVDCRVQLKDGYGFVIFDVPSNAEKAPRALRVGKTIKCAEHLDSNSGLPHIADLLDEEIGHHQEHTGDHGEEECCNSNGRLLDRGASVAPNLVDDDRWDEPEGETLNDDE